MIALSPIIITGLYCGPLRWQSLFELLAKFFERFNFPVQMPVAGS
jgi:hypothetical protein